MKETLKFVGFRDFYRRCYAIKTSYLKLSLEEKYNFKYYVYSNPLMKDWYKDMIWCFLHNDLTKEQLHKGYIKARV